LRRFVLVFAAVFLTAAGPASTPGPGPLRIVGGDGTGGCIAGAERLPPAGPGFQTIHLGHSSFWGAGPVIERIQRLGVAVRAAGLADFYVEDLSNPRGGPMAGGHAAHQVGLDADIGLDPRPKPALTPAEREAVEVVSVVRADQRGVDPARWSPAVTAVLRLAAGLPEVDRILVNPAIKRQLCQEVTGDRSWLRLIRPWYGHRAHMHIAFRCPAGQAECVPMAPPPPGDGCDATLQWWFDRLDAPAKPDVPPSKPKPPPALPAACRAIMAGTG
jgi:penicillin-insensitive murein endopeptidase